MENFPPGIQTLVTLLAGLLGLAAHFYGQLRKVPEKAKDVIVPGVSIVDGQTFREGTQVLRETIQMNEGRERMLRRFMAELEDHSEVLREISGHLESIDKRIAAEHYRLREKDGGHENTRRKA
jgi:hypothetical protein